MAKSKYTIAREILIEQSRDVIDVIMQIGGGLMPKTMLAAISDLPQYKDKNLLSQLKPLVKRQYLVMRDNETIKEYPSFLTSTRLYNHVIYIVSLANARLVDPGKSYTEPSLDVNALVRRLQLINHRINLLQFNVEKDYESISRVDSGFLTKQQLPNYLLTVASKQDGNSHRLLVSEAEYTKRLIERMAGARTGNVPCRLERDKTFKVLGLPTVLSLHQMGVYVLINHDSYMIRIYEGRNVRDVTDIVKLIQDATLYFEILLAGSYSCKSVAINLLTDNDKMRLAKRLQIKEREIKVIKDSNNIDIIALKSTSILEKYFGGIMI